MPISSSGRIVKTSKAKGAKFSTLDPIRRVRRHELDSEDLSATTSYFKNGLEKWKGLNASGRFVDFAYEVVPLCESLPQILHFEDKIMDLLVTYLEIKELVSIEPLLELLTDFARDLGVRFEKHYARALRIVTLIAGTSEEVEIIEWSFGCLAFMFKYLSKLLVSDLRPTYDLMAPLLGKENQKPHIARFAAEAMSFLIRKAAAPAVRGKALETVVLHCKADLIGVFESRQYGLYRHGLMTMFSEAIKGNRLSIHSSGEAILQCLFKHFDGNEIRTGRRSPWADLILGVLTSLVHHSNSEVLKGIVAAVLEEAADAINRYKSDQDLHSFQQLMLSARSIGILAGVRKGSRICNWPPLLGSLLEVLKTVSHSKTSMHNIEGDHILWYSAVLSTSIVFQYSPMDALIPFVSDYMRALTVDPLSKWFLIFCSYNADVDIERFKSIVLSYFQRFVATHWSEVDNEDTLCVIIPKLAASGALMNSCKEKDKFTLPQSWQDQIVSKFERLEISPFPEQTSVLAQGKSPQIWHERCLPKYRALLEVLECAAVHPSTNARIAEILLRKLKLALRPSSALAANEANFIVGYGFKEFSRMMNNTGEMDDSLGPLLRAAAPRYSRLPNFLDAMITYESALESNTNIDSKNLHGSIGLCKWPEGDGEPDLLIKSLIDNLCTDLHELRMLSLRLLDDVFKRCNGYSSEILTTMLLIERMPLDLQNSRSVSMHIRKLASLYKNNSSSTIFSRAIPYFCFGMIGVKLAQASIDAISALAQIAETSVGEDIIAELAFRWLEVPSVIWEGSGRVADEARDGGLTAFECSNMTRLDKLAELAKSQLTTAQDLLLENFETEQKLVTATPAAARAEALRVLCAIPRIAERRSRHFIPMFLSWAGRDEELVGESVADVAASKSNWTRKDQRAQLDIICLFNNPRVLYKSEDVYSSLLYLVTNGDLDVQKSAVKALFTWKSVNIRPYEENLLNLLDDARFKDEITLLLQGQTLIQPQHRAELMPLLLRLLYGRSVARKGAASGRQGMEARRLTVIRNLNLEDVGEFLNIALGGLKHASLTKDSKTKDSLLEKEILSVRRQHGLLNMVGDIVKELGGNMGPYTETILSAILYCLVFASRRLQKAPDIDEEENGVSQTSMLKANRQTGYKCLVLLFANSTNFDWSPFLPTILEELIIPRIEKLSVETTQGVSGVLQLLSTWASSLSTVLFLGEDSKILTSIVQCLTQPKSKEQVKLFVLAIVRSIIKHADPITEGSEGTNFLVRSRLLDRNIETFLENIGNVLRYQHEPSKELLQACVETITELAPFVSSSNQAYNLIDISVFLLDQPTRRVNPKTKNGLLQILERFVPLYELQADVILAKRIYGTISSLFGFFRDRSSREILSRVLQVYSRTDQGSAEIAGICADLNSFAERKLDEPDYDRRLRAFTSIVKSGKECFTARQWRPLLYNMLFYIRHDEEFGILSTNSSDGICKFLDSAHDASGGPDNDQFQDMLSSILVPAIYSGVREESELLRREYVKVMAHLARTFPNRPDVSDMHILLGGDDDELEASFFNNILSAGKGTQSKALGQLSAVAARSVLNSRSVSQFFIPLIEHFIFNRAEGNDGHHLAAEATAALGILAGSLDWGQYRSTLRRFIGYITSKSELEKQIIRLLGKFIDALANAADAKASFRPQNENSPPEERLVGPGSQAHSIPMSSLASSLPAQSKLTEDLNLNILPPLLDYLHDKDESKVSLRVPVAIIAVRLLKLLPHDKMMERLPAVLTDICHILRSKAQESRDLTRDTLSKICVLLGPSYFGFVLKELRGALARGYQVHVLSYTMHSILVATTPEYSPGDLDYCLPSIVAIIMDDIFGAAGQEKDAEEYVSKMKEVKSSKSHDSMELVARTATLSRLTDLVRPIQVFLKEKLNLRMVRKIDELLNRINSGLLKNAAVDSRDSLVFCYEVIQDAHASKTPQIKIKEDYRLNKYLVQSGASRSGSRGSTTVYTYKLVRFAFDVMRSVIKKYENLQTVGNLAGFVPIIGDALLDAEEEVKIAAFRLLTTIVKAPLISTQEGTDLYRVGAKEATASILSSSTTASDISQASLKFISAILRNGTDINFKNTFIDRLLEKLKDDITSPERRHTTFKFLRSVLNSKVETAIVYDTFDYVGTVMVTNDDKDTRDLARGAYFQFLGEYPQKRNRWTKQLAFLVANLKYEREGGRLSVLEVIHLLLSKSSNDFIQEVSATFFVPLIFALVNDDSEKCRMAAGEVIKEIFKKADKERLDTFLGLLRSWTGQHENASVMRLGFLSYGFYYLARAGDESDVEGVLASILNVLRTEALLDSDWEITYAALQLTLILCDKYPAKTLTGDQKDLWITVRALLSYPHAWVKLSSIRLMLLFFADLAKANSGDGLGSLPLRGSQGLRMSKEDIITLIQRLAGMFKTPNLTELLATEIVKSLFFLGRCAWESNIKWKDSSEVVGEPSDEEDDADDQQQQTALNYILGRLSFVLRQETSPPRAPALIPKTAALQLLQLLCTKLPAEALVPSLNVILLPLHNLTDPNIPTPYSTDELFKTEYEALKANSAEIMSLLQRKCGTGDYTAEFLRVREGVKARRTQRSTKRKIEAVAAPEKHGRDKQKKAERKKERRKEKGLEHRDLRRGW